MNFIQAIRKARRKAKATREPVHIVHDPIKTGHPEARYFPADDTQLAHSHPNGDIIAIVHPDGRIDA